MRAEVEERIKRLGKRLKSEPRFAPLLGDWLAIEDFLKRDQKNKEQLLDEYLMVVHFIELSSSDLAANAKKYLHDTIPMKIAKTVGDYDYAIPNEKGIARKRVVSRYERAIKRLAKQKEKEEAERKAQGRSYMGKSSTPTLTRSRKQQALMEKRKRELAASRQ